MKKLLPLLLCVLLLAGCAESAATTNEESAPPVPATLSDLTVLRPQEDFPQRQIIQSDGNMITLRVWLFISDYSRPIAGAYEQDGYESPGRLVATIKLPAAWLEGIEADEQGYLEGRDYNYPLGGWELRVPPFEWESFLGKYDGETYLNDMLALEGTRPAHTYTALTIGSTDYVREIFCNLGFYSGLKNYVRYYCVYAGVPMTLYFSTQGEPTQEILAVQEQALATWQVEGFIPHAEQTN